MHDESTVDLQRRQFLLTCSRVLGGVGAVCALSPFVASWLPSDKARAAGSPVRVDLSGLEPGQQMTVEWQSKPVWIIRRTPDMLQQLQMSTTRLRDPQSLVTQQPSYAQNTHRSIKPDYLVLVGLCTHLGCSPQYEPKATALRPDWSGGFVCPCHGSLFDLAGRVYKNMPAPINLEVPPHHFVSEHVVIIGEDVS